MAVGVEESSSSDLLTDNERRLLCEDAERQTAYALLALSQTATELGIETEIPSAADALRASMANLSPREQRKLRKSLERIGTLLVAGKAGTLAEVVSLPDAHHEQETPAEERVDAEQAALHVETVPQAEAVVPEAKAVAPADTESEQIVIDKAAAEKFYGRVNALSASGDLIAFEPYDEDEVLGLIALYAHASTKKIGMKSAIRLRRVLEGKGFAEISEAELAEGAALTDTGFKQFTTIGAPRFVAKHLAELFVPANKTDTKSVVPDAVQPVSVPAAKPMVNPSRTRVAPNERSMNDEPQYVQLAARFAKIIGFDSAQETAWRSMLDPANKHGEFTRNKADVCNVIIDELASRGWANIHDGYFEKLIPHVEAARVYKLLGLPFNPQALVLNRRMPTNQSVAQQIDEARRNGGQPNEVADQIFRGLVTIARELRENPKA